MKTAVTVAAAGGLIATVATPANAETPSRGGAATTITDLAPAASGPDQAVVGSGNALSAIGYTQVATKPAKPKVIEDIVVKQKRAAAKKAAAERAAAERASRNSTRTSLTTSTYTTKSTSNSGVSIGTKSSYNWATAGQCTWGALNLWYRATGFYPGGWTGNALNWAWGAANAGWTVTSTPRVRSIVVMQPGTYTSSSAGHVAWVTAVNGNQVTFTEMNALAGPYNYNTRTVTHVAGMKYILAP